MTSETNEPRMIELFGTEPTVADISDGLTFPQRFYTYWGIPKSNRGAWRTRQALYRKGILRDIEYCSLTRLGEAVREQSGYCFDDE